MNKKIITIIFIIILTLAEVGVIVFVTNRANEEILEAKGQEQIWRAEVSKSSRKLKNIEEEYELLKNSDQILINKTLTEEINNIQKGYQRSASLYEKMIELGKNSKIEKLWAGIIYELAKRNYASAAAQMDLLAKDIEKIQAQIAVTKIPANIPVQNNPPNSGFGKQVIKTDNGDFVVAIISADLGSNKLVVDTASERDCQNDCPVMPLGEFAKRSGAFAAINGPYFCPASYPSCANKKNSFDTLLMNKNKSYFNSDNNVYSSNPVAIFSSDSRFVEKGSDWGRDTSVDAVLMGRPLLVFNGEVRFGGNDDSKESSRGNRAFVGASGKTVYIGIVYSATVAEVARVLAKMGIKNAINLDSGGSTALWSNGRYIAGPGRDLPVGILLVRR